MKKIFPAIIALFVAACSPQPKEETTTEELPVVTSLLGVTYFEPERSAQTQARLDSNLMAARKNFEASPTEENYIWVGRRLGYLMRMQEAVDVFTEGLSRYPNSYKLLRHRGHRYISMRQFDKAVMDLTNASQFLMLANNAVEIEPDGQPNKINQPLSNTPFNIYYHLGLAHYLNGDFDKALQAYVECMKYSNNDDLLVATADWMYMTYRRLGKTKEAAEVLTGITDTMNIIENDSYYKRLLMYQGKLQPEDVLTVSEDAADADLSLATQGYGVGNWYLYNGDTAKATEIFEQVIAGKHFSAFGFIAAEAELTRMRQN